MVKIVLTLFAILSGAGGAAGAVYVWWPSPWWSEFEPVAEMAYSNTISSKEDALIRLQFLIAEADRRGDKRLVEQLRSQEARLRGEIEQLKAQRMLQQRR